MSAVILYFTSEPNRDIFIRHVIFLNKTFDIYPEKDVEIKRQLKILYPRLDRWILEDED